MSIVNEPATPEACRKDYDSRTANQSPAQQAAVQNPGRFTGNNGIHPKKGEGTTQK